MIEENRDTKETMSLQGSSGPSNGFQNFVEQPPLKTRRMGEEKSAKAKTTKKPREIGRFSDWTRNQAI